MFSRAYRIAITVPPLAWVAVFLLVPYLLMFFYSFWSVSPAQAIVHSWTFDNYHELLTKPVYWETLLRSMWIAARVTLFSMLLGYPHTLAAPLPAYTLGLNGSRATSMAAFAFRSSSRASTISEFSLSAVSTACLSVSECTSANPAPAAITRRKVCLSTPLE